jgi:hypothetical protein
MMNHNLKKSFVELSGQKFHGVRYGDRFHVFGANIHLLSEKL